MFGQGTVDNFVVTLPPVVRNLACTLSNGVAQVQCGSYVNWNYMLERSTNLLAWSTMPPCVNGTGNILIFSDTNAPATQAYYRVRADQP
jgi:hypothetical protein